MKQKIDDLNLKIGDVILKYQYKFYFQIFRVTKIRYFKIFFEYINILEDEIFSGTTEVEQDSILEYSAKLIRNVKSDILQKIISRIFIWDL